MNEKINEKKRWRMNERINEKKRDKGWMKE